MKTENKTQSGAPYLLGLLGFIPLVGFFVGIGLLLYGIIKYKDKKLIAIGAFCMLFTVVAYSSLFYFGFKSDIGKQSWAKMSQQNLNALVGSIEYYKFKNGHYPDVLQELVSKDEVVIIFDTLQSVENRKNVNFNYKKLGNEYSLYSSGMDGIANTADDFYPEIDPKDKNIGWVKPQ